MIFLWGTLAGPLRLINKPSHSDMSFPRFPQRHTVSPKRDNKEMLASYVRSNCSLVSSMYFLEMLRGSPPTKGSIINSLNFESLFTNVLADRTIQFILHREFRCEETPSIDITEEHIRTLLETCTKDAPFICPRSEMYCQVDWIEIGSPLREFCSFISSWK